MAEAKRPPRSIDQLKDASNRLKQKTQNEDRTGAGRDLVKDLTGMDLHKITQGTLSMQLNVIDRKTMAMMVDTSQMPIADTDVAGCDSPPPGCCCAAVSLLSGLRRADFARCNTNSRSPKQSKMRKEPLSRFSKTRIGAEALNVDPIRMNPSRSFGSAACAPDYVQ